MMPNQLATLIELRSRELDKRQAVLAQAQALQARVQRNVERLEQLDGSVSTGGLTSAALVQNTHAYKQGLQALADQQRAELLRQTTAVGEARTAVQAAAREQEVLSQLLQRTELRAQIAQSRQAQKRQDDLATQVWMRGPL